LNSLKIAYPKYQLFKSRLKVYLFKNVELVHSPIQKSVERVKKQIQELGLLCPMVLDPHLDRIRSGTNRYIELKKQGYDGSLFYKSQSGHEAELFHHINVRIFKNYPFINFDFIHTEDLKQLWDKCPDLLKEIK